MKDNYYISTGYTLPSCSWDKEYVIYGTVSNPDLEGAQVFWFHLKMQPKETIDSVYIHNQMFKFRGTEEKWHDIRIEMYKRYGNENLLVVTEQEKLCDHQLGEQRQRHSQNDSIRSGRILPCSITQQSGSLRSRA